MFDELVAHDGVKKIIDEADNKGDYALHLAISKKSSTMIDGLIKAGAKVDVHDSDGATALIAATKENLFPAVKSLITKKAKVLAMDKKGKQALDYASELGHNDIQYYLVNSGGDVSVLYNGKNKQGLQRASEEPTDKYGFFINQALYKKLIVVPNELTPDVSDKVKQQFTKILSKPKDKIVKNKASMKKLKKAIVNGKLPIASRKEMWKKFLVQGNEETGKLEEKLKIPKLDECLAKDLDFKFVLQIDKDIERCMRIHKDLQVRYGPGQCRLFRLLRAYAGYDQETCYTQGMATVAAFIQMHFEDDNEAFAALVMLFQRYKLHDWYRNDLQGLREEVFSVFSAMMEKYLKKTKRQLDSLHIAPSLIMTPWCLELFFSNLPYELVIRFWDLFVVLGPTMLYRMCLSIMKLNEDNIWAAFDVEGIYSTLKGNPIRDLSYEKVLKTALNKKFKWKQKQMDKFLAAGKNIVSSQGMGDD
jgi:hypothetical protein